MVISINEAHKEQRVTYGKTAAKPVKDYTQDELLELGIIARQSNNKVLLRCFTDLPPLADLQLAKTQGDLKQVADNAPARPAGKKADENKDKDK